MSIEETKRLEALDKAVQLVGEYYDHVQILATFHDNTGTAINSRGSGNWYARQGMAHAFIATEVAQENAVQIAHRLKE